MNPWNKYNQCMAIAARCGFVFCKLFKIDVVNHNSLWIDLYPINGSHNDNIHMVSDRNSNKLEIYFNLDSKKYPFSNEELNNIAYKLGVGMLNQYAIIDDGIIFFLDESKNIPLYEDSFLFIDTEQKGKTVTTDFPLIHYLQTELEVSTCLYLNSQKIVRPNAAVVKNGSSMFDIDDFLQQQSFLIIYISKINGIIDVELENNNFIENANNIFSSSSLISSLPFYGIDGDGINDATARIYLSASDDINYIHKVQINRFENYLLSRHDIENAIPLIKNKIGLYGSFDVNSFWGCH